MLANVGLCLVQSRHKVPSGFLPVPSHLGSRVRITSLAQAPPLLPSVLQNCLGGQVVGSHASVLHHCPSHHPKMPVSVPWSLNETPPGA